MNQSVLRVARRRGQMISVETVAICPRLPERMVQTGRVLEIAESKVITPALKRHRTQASLLPALAIACLRQEHLRCQTRRPRAPSRRLLQRIAQLQAPRRQGAPRGPVPCRLRPNSPARTRGLPRRQVAKEQGRGPRPPVANVVRRARRSSACWRF